MRGRQRARSRTVEFAGGGPGVLLTLLPACALHIRTTPDLLSRKYAIGIGEHTRLRVFRPAPRRSERGRNSVTKQ